MTPATPYHIAYFLDAIERPTTVYHFFPKLYIPSKNQYKTLTSEDVIAAILDELATTSYRSILCSLLGICVKLNCFEEASTILIMNNFSDLVIQCKNAQGVYNGTR